jgi:hypothetical protein
MSRELAVSDAVAGHFGLPRNSDERDQMNFWIGFATAIDLLSRVRSFASCVEPFHVC